MTLVGNGRRWPEPAPPRVGSGPRNRFAVLGNLSAYKGSPVILAAARQLADQGVDFTLDLHGRPLYQPDAFVTRIEEEVRALGSRARLHGGYRPDDVGAILAGADWVVVPSIWWENAPLVIEEAFHHARPVICSDIGGMAERVRDGVDGLHFRAGDARALADTMMQAAGEPGLWHRLAGAIRPPRDIAAAAADHLALYRDLLTDAAPIADDPAPAKPRRAAVPRTRGSEAVSPARA